MEKSKSDFSTVISATKITIDQTLNALQVSLANPSEVDSLNSKICLLKVITILNCSINVILLIFNLATSICLLINSPKKLNC